MKDQARRLSVSVIYATALACASSCINEQDALKLYGAADAEQLDTKRIIAADADQLADTEGRAIGDTTNLDIAPGSGDAPEASEVAANADGSAADGGESADGCGSNCAEPPPPISGLVDPAWAFDAASGKGWLFGGETWYALSNTLFSYSAQPNTISWNSKQDPAGPPARARATMTAAADGKSAFLFGGQGYYTLLNDLWQLDAEKLTWTQLKAGGATTPERHGHIAFFSGGKLVTGQGEGYYGLREDWFAYDPKGNSWGQLVAPVMPARRRAAIATDATTGSTWVYGGEDYYTLLSDLWQLELKGEQLVATQKVLDLNALPPVTDACALANAGQFWLTGGQSYYKIVPERWQLDLKTGKSISSPSGYASTGAICLRRKDGQAQWLLGQGFYEMSQIPLIFSMP